MSALLTQLGMQYVLFAFYVVYSFSSLHQLYAAIFAQAQLGQMWQYIAGVNRWWYR